MAEPAKQEDPVYDKNDSRPVTGPDLRAQEGIGSNTGTAGGGARSRTPSDGGGATDSTGDGPAGIKDREAAAGSGNRQFASRDANNSLEGGFYREDSGSNSGQRGERLKSGLGRLGNVSRRKLLIIAAPVAGILAILVLLLIFLSSLKLPQITQNIENYEFARVTSQVSQNAQRVSDESLALEATSDSTHSAFKAKFFDPYAKLYSNVRDSTWGRLDAYRPNQVIETLGDTHGLQLHFKTSSLGRKVFTGATLDGTFYPVKQVTGIPRFVPNLNKLLVAKNNLTFYQGDFMPALLGDMKTDGTATLIRGAVANSIIQQTGGSRVGYVLSKFTGLNDSDARIEASVQMYDATQKGATFTDNAVTQEIAQADSAATNATNQAVSSWTPSTTTSTPIGGGGATTSTSTLPVTISTGNDEPALAAADSALNPSLFKSVLGVADPLYAIFTPICIIYDGSVQQSGPTIDNQTNQQENAFDQLAAEADQQKKGDQPGDNPNELATAIGGANAEVGDVSTSIPYQRSSGNTVDTSTIQSAEAGADGSYNYSLLNAIGLSPTSSEGQIANWIAGNSCGLLTSTGVAGGLAALNIGAAILSFGGTQAGEDAAGQGAIQFTTAFVKNAVSNIFSSQVEKQVGKNGIEYIERSALNRVQRFVFKQGLVVGGTYGLTELAHMEVAARAGQGNNGLAQNTDLVNEADSGANIEAGQLEQKQLFGRPLTNSEVGQSDQLTKQYVYAQNQSRSFTQRYFALSNPDSLFSHLSLDISGNINSSSFSSIAKLSAVALKPLSYLGSLLSFSGMAHASPNPSTQHYGNVQFGWTQDEEKLIDSDSSYKPLENQHILDAYSTATDQIAQKYAVCFGYQYNAGGNGDLDPTDSNGNLQLDSSATLGNLLAKDDIQRDSNGNVVDNPKILCSPSNLSYNSPDSLAANPYSTNNKKHDLIFRWRLAMSYDTTLDQLINEQTITSGSTPTGPTTPTTPGTLPTGSAQSLAQQLLPLITAGKIKCGSAAGGSGPADCLDIQNTAKGIPIGGNCAVNALTPHLLGLILELVQEDGWTVGISAICSNHSPGGDGPYAGHSYGSAADFSIQNGATGAAAAADEKFVDDAAALLSQTGGSFGQIECHPTYPVLNNPKFTTFDDTCTHQHIRAAP